MVKPANPIKLAIFKGILKELHMKCDFDGDQNTKILTFQ
jgi:hypothetical protein